jgi:hypothetical protein
MTPGARSAVFPLAEARKLVPGSAGEHFAGVAERGSLRLLLSLPVRPNVQKPHSQDELYVVARGSGVLFHGGQRSLFGPAAGVEHHFEDFTADLEVWAMFYGPVGGEG